MKIIGKRRDWVATAIASSGVLIALAIGFDDAALSPYQLKIARLLASVAGGFGVIFSALRYVWERQQELAWQKTSFMVGLFEDFEKNEPLRRAQELVDLSRFDETRLKAALRPLDELHRDRRPVWRRWAGEPDHAEALRDRLALDRYLDFFDHLYTYIFITKTLDAADVASFSGYAIDILDSELLSDACFEWGYEDVLRLAIHYAELAAKERRRETVETLKAEVVNRRKLT